MEGARHDNPDGTYTITHSSGRKIVYEKDGTPCRSCNSLLDFKAANMFKNGGSSGSSFSFPSSGSSANGAAFAGAAGAAASKDNAQDQLPKDCPADVEQLGNGTWTLLHSIAAKYPEHPSTEQQGDLRSFVTALSKLYPCWFCAADFRTYISKNEVEVKDQNSFGKWLCNAHNEVNVKLGKPVFDCNLWKQRWKDGWEDGRCN